MSSDWNRTPGRVFPGCRSCKHLDRATLACVAYPRGIPLPIASSQIDHFVSRPGQLGDTVFEQKELPRRALPRASAAPADEMVDTLVRVGLRHHGVNVYVFTSAGNRISVPRRMRARLERWALETGTALHMVAFDRRDGEDYSGHDYYYRRGIRSTTLSQMVHVTSGQHLRELVGR